MSEILFVVGSQPVSFGMALAGGGGLLLAALLVLVIAIARGGAARTREAEDAAQRAEDLELRLAEVARVQAETVGRLQTMGEGLAARQSDLARLVNERLDAVSGRIGQSMEATTKQTVERLQHLHERLALIDNAQKNLNELSSQVTSLRDVLSNKQARGAFGQARMEAIVQDGLPKGSFQFQFTLSNNTRPDCVVFMPDQPPLVIDAKFPLEAVTAHRDAKTDDQRRVAAQRLRQDILRHVADIAGKYLIPGETQDLALMFVPAELVYSGTARHLRRRGAEVLSVAGHHRLAIIIDASYPSDAADPQGCPDARRRGSHSPRGRAYDQRRRPHARTGAQAAAALHAVRRRSAAYPDIGREGRTARGGHRGTRFR